MAASPSEPDSNKNKARGHLRSLSEDEERFSSTDESSSDEDLNDNHAVGTEELWNDGHADLNDAICKKHQSNSVWL